MKTHFHRKFTSKRPTFKFNPPCNVPEEWGAPYFSRECNRPLQRPGGATFLACKRICQKILPVNGGVRRSNLCREPRKCLPAAGKPLLPRLMTHSVLPYHSAGKEEEERMKGTTTATGRILPAVRRQTYQVSQLWANSTADESPSHLENT